MAADTRRLENRTSLVLAVAPNGARKTHNDHPQLPITPSELADCAAACREMGASMLHLHVRDAVGRHSLAIADYRAALAAVRRAIGQSLVIQVTSESVGKYTSAAQIAMIRELRPEAVSIALRELLAGDAEEIEVAAFLAWAHREHIVIQFILYDIGDIRRYIDLRKRGIIAASQHWVLFVLGRYSGGDSSLSDLLPMIGLWSAHQGAIGDVPWAVCAFGRREIECGLGAAALGGHVRIGFENNVYLPDGRLAKDNSELIGCFANIAKDLGYCLADATSLRAAFA